MHAAYTCLLHATHMFDAGRGLNVCLQTTYGSMEQAGMLQQQQREQQREQH